MYNTEINNATLYTNTTTLPMTTTPNHELNIPEWAGYIAAAIAAVGFGSNFIPVKKFETGDGKPIMLERSDNLVNSVLGLENWGS